MWPGRRQHVYNRLYKGSDVTHAGGFHYHPLPHCNVLGQFLDADLLRTPGCIVEYGTSILLAVFSYDLVGLGNGLGIAGGT